MSHDADTTASESERDARALSSIIRSLEKLRDIEPDQAQPGEGQSDNRRAPVTPEDEDQLRLRIAERLVKLRQQRATARSDGSDR